MANVFRIKMVENTMLVRYMYRLVMVFAQLKEYSRGYSKKCISIFLILKWVANGA